MVTRQRVSTKNESVRGARHAGLRYSTDRNPGLRRVGKAPDFHYVNARGRRIKNQDELQRIRALAIPPAWTDVWIAPHGNEHLQATGRDAKGRKQYRYHGRWRKTRDAAKYHDIISFAKSLPRIRRRVARDLRRRGLCREKALATIVRLLETTLIRVGNEEYARENHSFGLTTLRNHHAKVRGKRLTFQFRGKSGINHQIDVESPKLARVVKQCQDLPGQDLFGYVDEDGKVHDIDSGDVNDYLRKISGQENVSAKDFRTWAGTALAAQALQEFEEFDTHARAKRNVTRAIERVAARLGNTATVCRKCYVHPAIIDAYLDRSLLKTFEERAEGELNRSLNTLKPEEAAVLAFLQERMKRKLNRGQPFGRRKRQSG